MLQRAIENFWKVKVEDRGVFPSASYTCGEMIHFRNSDMEYLIAVCVIKAGPSEVPQLEYIVLAETGGSRKSTVIKLKPLLMSVM